MIIDSIREIGDSVATQRRYFVSSLPRALPASPMLCGPTGPSKTALIGPSIWPSARTNARCGFRVPHRTLPSCGASPRGFEEAQLIGLHLRQHLAGLAVRGIRHRRVRASHYGLAREPHHAYGRRVDVLE